MGNILHYAQDLLQEPQTTALPAAFGRAGHNFASSGWAMERCFKVMRGGHGQQVQPANSVLAQLNDDPIEDWDAELGLEPPTIRFGSWNTVPWTVVSCRWKMAALQPWGRTGGGDDGAMVMEDRPTTLPTTRALAEVNWRGRGDMFKGIQSHELLRKPPSTSDGWHENARGVDDQIPPEDSEESIPSLA